MSRDAAYERVQSAAAAAWDEGASFRERIAGDPQVRERIGERLGELFDPMAGLARLDVVFDRLEKVVVEEPG
jgi:adenylosuccinate lyase